MVRLRPGQTLEAGAAGLNAARPAIRDATMPPDADAERRAGYLADRFTLAPAATGMSTLRNRFAQPLAIIMFVVAAVLLIACANIANLMLAPAMSRRHEMTLRLALGASRARLGCQLFIESLLLAVAGAAAGLALVRVGAAILVRQLGTGTNAVTLDPSTDWRVLGFTGAVAVGATLLFGLAPALGLSGLTPGEVLKEQSRTFTADRRFGIRGALVVAQVAMSFALVAGAGLFVRTFTTLVTTPLGFDPQALLIVSLDARNTGVSAADSVPLFQRVADGVTAAPGVSRASLSFMTPMSGLGWNTRIGVTGGPVLGRREQVTWDNAVAPGWFETYGMRLLAGRDFSASDAAGGEHVAIVNETFARRFTAPGNRIGQRMKSTSPGIQEIVIIGVVNDAVYRTARAGAVATIYLPMTQGGPFGSNVSITARMGADRATVERSVAESVRRIDPKLAVSFRDYSDQVRATVVQERLVAVLSGFFGGLALLLAALGLYGVTSYSVSRRRAELAVRMALGASTGGIVRLVLGRISVVLLAGTAIGLALILWAGQFIGGLLFRVEARDPVTLGGAAIVLILVGMFAGWLPARGVARLDPTTALRE
ncbi:hypothetical protein BH24ACI5_BH24ACI5_13830 [soil metagenome]